MKIIFLSVLIVLLVFVGCDNDESYYGVKSMQDTVPPSIRIIGYAVDTTYLYADYKDPGAEVYDYKGGIPSCKDATLVTEVEGIINNRLPGTYFIHYKGNDTLGYPLPVATRTVHVIENSSTFLNGEYSVVCSCTAIAQSATQPIITTGEYTARVTSGNQRNAFNLNALELGSEVVVPDMILEGNKINVGFWSPHLVQISESVSSGTLSPARNSFTVETTTRPYDPAVIYHCKNIFTKKLIIH